MELLALIILILLLLNIHEKCSELYFDIPTVDEYLNENPKCHTEYGISCVMCKSNSIKKQDLINSSSYLSVHVCNHCGLKLYRS